MTAEADKFVSAHIGGGGTVRIVTCGTAQAAVRFGEAAALQQPHRLIAGQRCRFSFDLARTEHFRQAVTPAAQANFLQRGGPSGGEFHVQLVVVAAHGFHMGASRAVTTLAAHSGSQIDQPLLLDADRGGMTSQTFAQCRRFDQCAEVFRRFARIGFVLVRGCEIEVVQVGEVRDAVLHAHGFTERIGNQRQEGDRMSAGTDGPFQWKSALSETFRKLYRQPVLFVEAVDEPVTALRVGEAAAVEVSAQR